VIDFRTDVEASAAAAVAPSERTEAEAAVF
jgi:hypothetical protein